MKIWRYSSKICWTIFGLIIFIFVWVYFKYGVNLSSLLLFIVGEGAFYVFIKTIINDFCIRGHLSELGSEGVKYLIKKSDNPDILPIKKIKVEGIGKDLQEDDDLRKGILKIFLLKAPTDELKGKISLKIANHFLPTFNERKLLSVEALESLRLFVALKITKDTNVLYQLNQYIQQTLKDDNEVKKWFNIWGSIDKALPSSNTHKNPLFQFLGPKLEYISKNKKINRIKAEKEVMFLIECLSRNQLPIVYIDVYGNNEKEDFKRGAGYFLRTCQKFFKNYSQIVIVSRGKNNWINQWIKKKLLSNNSIKYQLYDNLIEVDEWNFPGKKKRKTHKVTVMWNIIIKK